jgi:hypothetical protein
MEMYIYLLNTGIIFRLRCDVDVLCRAESGGETGGLTVEWMRIDCGDADCGADAESRRDAREDALLAKLL